MGTPLGLIPYMYDYPAQHKLYCCLYTETNKSQGQLGVLAHLGAMIHLRLLRFRQQTLIRPRFARELILESHLIGLFVIVVKLEILGLHCPAKLVLLRQLVQCQQDAMGVIYECHHRFTDEQSKCFMRILSVPVGRVT